MAILQAIILGIIEGLTEFLPISSTGHLIVAQHMMRYKDTAETFTVVIQMGAILAVVWFYRHELCSRMASLMKRRQGSIPFWRNWIIATIPAGVAGLLLSTLVSNASSSFVVAVALIVGGVLIWLVEQYHRAPAPAKRPDIGSLTTTQSIKIGLFQVLALIPGVSRSGATIMGGLLVGVDRVTATAFSFYLSIPVIILASGYKLATGWENIPAISGGGTAVLVGILASFVTALAAVTWLLRYVSTHDFKPFAYYRVALGVIILGVLSFASL